MWCVNDLGTLAEVVDLGVNGVISDQAEVLREVLRAPELDQCSAGERERRVSVRTVASVRSREGARRVAVAASKRRGRLCRCRSPRSTPSAQSLRSR